MTDEIDSNKQESAETDKSDFVETNLKSDDSGIVANIDDTQQTHDSELPETDSNITVSMTNKCEHSDENNETECTSVNTQCESNAENDESANPIENLQENHVDSEIEPVIKSKEDPGIKVEEDQTVTQDIESHSEVQDNGNYSDSDKTENIVTVCEGKEESILEDKDRQSSIEEKSHPSPWSFSQWSENYESLEDERPMEEIAGDPQKLILWAAEKNELDTVRKLLEEDATLIDARDNDLYTPLHRASYSNNVEVIKILLSFDADISSKTADGWEPLHCACKWDSVEAVSLLLQNGANVNARTKGNITPLHLAASNASGRRTLELLLWQPYIDPNLKTDAGDTAYDIAYRTGPLGALFEILEESVNIY